MPFRKLRIGMKQRLSPIRSNSQITTTDHSRDSTGVNNNRMTSSRSSTSRSLSKTSRNSSRKSSHSTTTTTCSSSSGSAVNGSGGGSSNAWMRSHPLEGDGVLVNFFHFLFKKNKDLMGCPVRIPQTIVYEHNFPRDWFTYDEKTQEIRKTSGKDLDTKRIAVEFTRGHQGIDGDSSGASTTIHNENTSLDNNLIHNNDFEQEIGNTEIVASYLSQTEDASGQLATIVEFFDKQGLDEFLYKRSRREYGILQQFIPPKGAYNSTVQAIWSPHVIRVERRSNAFKLIDNRRKQRVSNFERSVTYEGPAHYSTQVLCAPQLKKEVSEICENIVNHFYSTEHRRITRMVLYFKVDALNRVWLLWSSCIRVKSNHATNNAVINGLVANELNLAPRFLPPNSEMNDHGLFDQVSKPQWTKSNNHSNLKLEELVDSSIHIPRVNTPPTPNKCFICGLPLKSRRTLSPIIRHNDLNRASFVAVETTSMLDSQKKEEKIHVPDTDEIRSLLMLVEELEDLSYACHSHFLDECNNFRFIMPLNIQEARENQNDIIIHYWQTFEQRLGIRSGGDSDHCLYISPTNNIKLQKSFAQVIKDIQAHIEEKRQELLPPRESDINPINMTPDSRARLNQSPQLSPSTPKRHQGRQLCDLCSVASPRTSFRSRRFSVSSDLNRSSSRSDDSSIVLHNRPHSVVQLRSSSTDSRRSRSSSVFESHGELPSINRRL